MRPNTSSAPNKTKTDTKKYNLKKSEDNIDQVDQANQPSKFDLANDAQVENGDDMNMVNSLVFSNSEYDEGDFDNNVAESDLEDFESREIIDDKQWDTDIEDESGKFNKIIFQM